jgi:hypothetical protein
MRKEEKQPLEQIQYSLHPEEIKGVIIKQDSLNASIIPSSSGTQLVYRTMLAGENLGDLPSRIEDGTRGKTTLTIDKADKARKIIQTRAGGVDEIEIENIELLPGGKKGSAARKMLVYLLAQTAKQALNNGETTKPRLIVTYEDLIAKGLYKNTKTASRGIERAFDVLSSLKIKGYTTRRGKNKRREQVEAGVLFYHMKKTGKGSVIISLNDNFNWEYLAQAYTMIPNVYYSLPSNAGDLFYYIFYLARQRHEEIKKNKGTFPISYRSIQRFLMLPDETTATKATTQIKVPIEEAIANIENKVAPDLIELYPDNTEYINIAEYLDKRFLVVTLGGQYLKYFTEYFTSVEKVITTNEKRRQKNIDIAQQKAIQKKLETAADTPEPPADDTKK